MATAKQEKNTKPAAPVLPGIAQASKDAGSILTGSRSVASGAWDALIVTGMVKDGRWVGFPEGFPSMLAIAEAITPQPQERNAKGQWVRMSRATVGFIPRRKWADKDDKGQPLYTPAEVQHSKDVHTVADALSTASLDVTHKGGQCAEGFGRPAGSRQANHDTDPGAPAPKVTAKDARSAAATVAKVLTGDKVTTPAAVAKVTADLAESVEILAARIAAGKAKADPKMAEACKRYLIASGALKVSTQAPVKATPATLKASKPSMPGSQVV